MNRIALTALLILAAGCELDSLDPNGDAATLDDSANTATDAGLNECAPVQALSCDDVVSSDTSDWDSGATEALNGYSVAIGNYAAPEITYAFTAAASGSVTFALVDPTPTELDHDVFVLDGIDGCRSDAAIERGFNAITFDAEAGATYFFVVDGFGGDAGAFDAAVSCDGGSSLDVPTPDPATYGECTFGNTTRDLTDAPHITHTQVGNYRSLSELPDLVGEQMWLGVEEDGWGWFADLAELFDNADDDGVYETVVLDQITGATYTWLRWYAGDTEIGYVFDEGSLNLVAKIGDGDIYDCAP